MKTMCSITVAVGVLVSAPAYAYLDPGSGSMLLQIILGGLAGIAVAGKLFWQRIASFFSFGKGRTEAADSTDSGSSN